MGFSRNIATAFSGFALVVAMPIARAEVDVSGTATCVEPGSATVALEDVLRGQAASREIDLLLTVTELKGDGVILVTLKAMTGDGAQVLDRTFELSEADCPSSIDLLSTVTSRFLEELPLERWTLEPPRRASPAPKLASAPLAETPEPLSLTVALRLGADLQFAPAGASLGGGVVADLGKGSHALFLDLDVRGSVPQSLGQGSYYTLTLAGGLGWRFSDERWLGRIGARAGAVRVAGSGFSVDGAEWLPWAELHGGAGKKLGPVNLLFTAALSPYRHTAVTSDGVLQQDISNFRLGLALEVPLVETDL